MVNGGCARECLCCGLRGAVRQGASNRSLRLVAGDVDDRPAAAIGQEAADRGRASDDRRSEVQPDQLEHLARGCGVERRVTEHRGVVHPSGELPHRLRPVRRLLGDFLVCGAANDSDHPRPRRVAIDPLQGGWVQLYGDDAAAIGDQTLDDRPADTSAPTRHDVRPAHRTPPESRSP